MHLTAARKIRASQNFERTELTEYEKIGFYMYWRLDIISSSSVFVGVA